VTGLEVCIGEVPP